MKPLVVIESPFRGADFRERLRNIHYAQLCIFDSIERGELPFASHLFYPQILSEDDPVERELGITLSIEMARRAQLVAVYLDFGYSEGMLKAIDKARLNSIPIQNRWLVSGVHSLINYPSGSDSHVKNRD